MQVKFQTGGTRNHTPSLRELATLRPEFSQCEKIWADVLEPELRRRESHRAEVVNRAKRKSYITGAATVVLAIVLLILTNWPFPPVFFVSAVAGVIATAAYAGMDWVKVFSVRTETKELILGAACTPFGFKYDTLHPDLKGVDDWSAVSNLVKVYGEKSSPRRGEPTVMKWGADFESDEAPTEAYDALVQYDLLPHHHEVKFEDKIEGERAAAKFNLVEAACKNTSGDSSETTFEGLLFHIEYPRRFLGKTVISRKELRNSWFDTGLKDLKRVKLVATELDDAFRVYSNDQVEARALLTPDRMERLIALERHFKGGKLRAIFEDGHMSIALEAGNQFEAGSVFETLIDQTRFAQALVELGLVCDVIDGWLTRDWVKDKI